MLRCCRGCGWRAGLGPREGRSRKARLSGQWRARAGEDVQECGGTAFFMQRLWFFWHARALEEGFRRNREWGEVGPCTATERRVVAWGGREAYVTDGLAGPVASWRLAADGEAGRWLETTPICNMHGTPLAVSAGLRHRRETQHTDPSLTETPADPAG